MFRCLRFAIYVWCTLTVFATFSVGNVQNDGSQNRNENKPNIIIIIADDLGFNDVSIHGSNEIPTPNIDALGIMGIQLNKMYAAPMCSPSRSSFLTGKYPSNLGMQHSVISVDEPFGLDPKEKTMADYMKCAGYRTHLIGKWHLGFFEKRYTPLYRGFDSHYGYLGPYIDYFNFSSTETDGNTIGYDMRKNLTVDWDAHGQYATDLFTKQALATIDSHNKSVPLFMVIAHLAVHAGNKYEPLQASKEDIKKFSYIKNKNRRVYAAMLSKLDESVGKVIGALEKNKMIENSIILFMSDNGAPVEGSHSNSGSNFPFRGQKNSPWEGAVRSTAAVWSTRLKRRQRISNQMVHITDWLPTFAKIAGFNVDSSIDGKDIWNALSYNIPSPRSELLVHHDATTPYMAYISNNYKLISGTTNNGTYDRWLYKSSDRLEQNKTFGDHYSEAILTSAVGQVLSKFTKNIKNQTQTNHVKSDRETISEFEINEIRSKAKVTCNGHELPANDSDKICNPLVASCLFDILNDPCETTNLASQYPKIVMELETKLEYYGSVAKPIRNRPADPWCNPSNFDGVWTWWYDELNSAIKLLGEIEQKHVPK